jgi:proline iminopeptidase
MTDSPSTPTPKGAVPDISLFGDAHIARYRATNGADGHIWNGAPCLVLTTKGRKSGEDRSFALIYGLDGDNVLLVASKGGAPDDPGWYKNLVAEPRVEVQILADVFPSVAHTATGAERDRLWPIMAAVWPNYDAYAERTDRTIPVVVLERV